MDKGSFGEGLPSCRRGGDIGTCSGRRVRVIGVYVELDLRKNPEPPAEYHGSAGIRIEDGAEVLLEPSWSRDSMRSVEERRRFAGKRVEAVGTLWAEPPKPPTPRAYVLGPCLSPVEAVREAG